jgi:hypothetical protein
VPHEQVLSTIHAGYAELENEIAAYLKKTYGD